MKTFSNILLSFFFGLAGAVTFSVLQNYLYSRPIATVEIDTLINEHLSSVAGMDEVSEAERERMAGVYADKINNAITRISDSQRVTLLVKPAVLSNMPDYTALVREAIANGGGNVN